MRVALGSCVALALAFGCGGSDGEGSAGAGGTAAADSGTGGAGAADASWPDAATDSEAGPTTQALDPCATDSCWTAPVMGACGSQTFQEDFGSGLYAAHRYLLMLPAGVSAELSASHVAGVFEPAIVLHDEQGNTLHDGSAAWSSPEATVTSVTANAQTTTLQITTNKRVHFGVYVTSAAAIQGAFATPVSKDAQYSLSAKLDCPVPAALTVNGTKLSARQDLWVRYVATQVVPKMSGPEAERIDKAAHVTWWALKEGVLSVNNPLSYSNCSIPPDKHIGPVELCPNPKNAWQVGLSGVQAAYRTLDSVEAVAKKVYPSQSSEWVLERAAARAGLGIGTVWGQAIAESTDRLRISWLLRNGPVGFEAQYPTVHGECFAGTKSWCFGSGWPSSAAFAANKAAAQASVADLKAIFAQLAP